MPAVSCSHSSLDTQHRSDDGAVLDAFWYDICRTRVESLGYHDTPSHHLYDTDARDGRYQNVYYSRQTLTSHDGDSSTLYRLFLVTLHRVTSAWHRIFAARKYHGYALLSPADDDTFAHICSEKEKIYDSDSYPLCSIIFPFLAHNKVIFFRKKS